MEERFFTDWYPWHLFRVGGALFADVVLEYLGWVAYLLPVILVLLLGLTWAPRYRTRWPALLVMTGVLLRQFLKKPMSRFIKMVDTYAAGESDAFKQGAPYSEFGPLVDVLDEMGEKIASQMRSSRK